MRVDVSALEQGDTVILGGRLAIVEQVAPFMGAYDVVFRRPGSINAATFHVRGDVERVEVPGYRAAVEREGSAT